MASNKLTRKILFDKFVKHLDILRAHSVSRGEYIKSSHYICPICLRQFSETSLDVCTPNMLTIEHSPPKEVGGKAVALTCKDCNSKAGSELDIYLVNRLRRIDRNELKPGIVTQAKATFSDGKIVVQSTLKVNSNGRVSMDTSDYNNNPINMEKLQLFHNNKQPFEITFSKYKDAEKRVQVALLKTAYVLLFSKFGYSFLLTDVYDIVRKQILEPDAEIYPIAYTSEGLPEDLADGIYPILDKGGEGLLSIFTLTSSVGTIYRIGICLPIPGIDPDKTVVRFKTQLDKTIDLIEQKEDFLLNVNQMMRLPMWFKEIREGS